MNVITTPDPDSPGDAAKVLATLAQTAFDPVVRAQIAAAVAAAVNRDTPIHLRPTGNSFPALKPLRSTGIVKLPDCLVPATAAAARAHFERIGAGPYTVEDVLDAPGLVEAMTQDLLLNTLREYFEAPPTLLSARVWWAAPGAEEGFRRDRSDIRTARLVIYLTDVARGNGADEYIVNSADLAAVLSTLQERGAERSLAKRIFAPGDAFPLAELQRIFAAQYAVIDGAAGEGFVANGYGLHRQGPVRQGRRLAFEAIFGIMPAPDAAPLRTRDMEKLAPRLGGAPLAHHALRLVRQAGDAGESRALPAATAPAIRLVSKLNEAISRSERGKTISVIRDPFITRKTKIFTIGSCFALEIRKTLAARGFDVYPKYREIAFDDRTQSLAKLPTSDNINHYNTFSIRQEFEVAFGELKYTPQTFWEVPVGYTHLRPPNLFQAPYRKQIYATGRDAAADLNAKLDGCISAGIHGADAIVVTLGLIESWFNLTDGLAVATAPHDAPNSSLARFHLSTYAENYANLKRICDLVLGHYPNKHLIFTVSPVALGTTYSGNDVIVANCESKSVLRAAAGQIMREYPSVRYWPSFEIANAHDIREADGSHVTPEGVKMIMDAFLAAHCED